jgi:hypothetical protein
MIAIPPGIVWALGVIPRPLYPLGERVACANELVEMRHRYSAENSVNIIVFGEAVPRELLMTRVFSITL